MKLVGTFSCGVAATLTATSLQVGSPMPSDRWSAIWLAASVLALFALIVLDRITEADADATLKKSAALGWGHSKLQKELRASSIAAANSNEKMVAIMRTILLVQVALAAASGITAVTALLSPA